ncbi:type 1 periplasmic-binding domain-containing protein [Subtercola endophyticus]|uniref:hypothetical protein n=1 Tax=Subtercola endophyticus TaxID=2895559 RepID=UPI001E5B917F|nr:hypothetical protein [Subtercola endophyticus]UFS60908.1 hypothetical protein LQ955_09320 [Subtercola endophyticus]
MASLGAVVLGLVLLAGCSATDSWAEPHAAPAPLGALGDGFLPSATPSPEATINPAPESWTGVHPSPGFRVVLLTAGDDEPTRALLTAVNDWAAAENVELRTVHADVDPITSIVRAIDMKPDLVISAGNDLVDPLATVTASHLDQLFLIVGAEVAEPTHNVTAVDWTGASFRGEGLGASSDYDPSSFTPSRTAAAVRAGAAAVLHDVTGIVIWIP